MRHVAAFTLIAVTLGCAGSAPDRADTVVSSGEALRIADTTTFSAGDLRIEHVVAPKPAAVPGSAPAIAVYFSVRNTGAQADTLVGVEVAGATATLHQQTGTGGGMEAMVPLALAVIPPGESMRFFPGGRHVMIEGLARPIEAGEQLPLTMIFRRAGRAGVDARVITYGDLDDVLAPDMHTGH